MSLAVFISCSEAKQVAELKKFLKSHGAKSLETSECREDNWPEEFSKCIEHLNICWKDEGIIETEVNDVLTTVASLVIQLPSDKLEKVVNLLCDEYMNFSGDNSRKHKSKLFSLNLLFHGLAPESRCKCEVYLTLVSCAKECGVLQQIVTDPKKVASWLSKCRCSVEECQQVWRKLHETHAEQGQNRRATEALVYLLSTYTEANAAEGRQDAIKCIIAVMQDPSLLAHDQLNALRPVQYLEGEPVHDNGLDEDACLHKLRLLTLMQISENQTELTYDAAVKGLELPEEKLEPFIIEAVRQLAVACKLDQVQRRILITGAFPRTFGRPQWLNLHETLMQWHAGLSTVQKSIGSMIQAETN